MCGIIGIIGKGDVAPNVIDGLKRLEYRGYDSAGIATLVDGVLHRRRATGKLSALQEILSREPLSGASAIGHTRWATHGAATQSNAHPHATERVAIVHNGIIENFADLRERLKQAGRIFESQTDSEVIAQLITHNLETGAQSPQTAFAAALKELKGAFAIAALFTDQNNLLLAARAGSPLAIGHGQSNGQSQSGSMYIGSDAYALAPFTNRITYLEDGDYVAVTRQGAEFFDLDDQPVSRPIVISSAADAMVDKDGHRHFMAKEIYEQPVVIAHTLARHIDAATGEITSQAHALDFARLPKLVISACGTAFYAGLIAKYWFETLAKLPVEVDFASELRYRDTPYAEGGAALFISQSGETADTLAALRQAKAHGQKIAAIVNVPESSIARETDVLFPMAAGPEIGVASTKAFTCQLAALAALAIAAGAERGVLSNEEQQRLTEELLTTPRLIGDSLKNAAAIEAIAHDLAKAQNILYIGRGVSYPLALEGALKLKEISYIHAEGFGAGELKHGAIALVDEETPIIIIAPSDRHFEKTVSNMQEVMARGGKALLISDAEGVKAAGDGVWSTIETPTISSLFSPIVYAGALQLLAYYTATSKGTDVDQPRNLAKSVTVE